MTEVAFFLFIAPLNPVRGLRRVAPPHRQGNWAAHPYKPVYSPSPFMERGNRQAGGVVRGRGEMINEGKCVLLFCTGSLQTTQKNIDKNRFNALQSCGFCGGKKLPSVVDA